MLNRLVVIILMLIGFSAPAFAGSVSFGVRISPAPPDLYATIEFVEPSGNKMLDAEETARLVITVQNKGKGDAFDVVAELKPDKDVKGLVFDRHVPIGTVASGATVKKEVPLKASEELPADILRLSIDIKEANGFDADQMKLSFELKAFEPPKLVVADVGIEDQNGNSKIEPLENVEITVRVQNMGHGDARGVVVNVENGENVYIGGDGKAAFDIGALGPGEFKDVTFMFYTNKRLKDGDNIPLLVNIAEARAKYGHKKPLALAINARQKSVSEIMVKGVESPKSALQLASGLSVDVEQNLPKTKMANPDAIAVVIGNRDYRKAKPVEYAVNDAEAIRLYLTDVLGFKEGNVFFASNATKGDFELFFGNRDNHRGKLYNAVKAGVSDVFIFYSGHGAPGLKDNKGYFVPVEADPQYIELGGYQIDVFYENLGKVPARTMTVALDACFSGANIFDNISPAMLKVVDPVINLKNSVVLSSSSGSQVSSWYNEKKHGMFTYFFLKAMHNKNADYDNNGELTYEEVYKYISDNSDGVPYFARRVHGVEQTPTMEGDYKGRVLLKY